MTPDNDERQSPTPLHQARKRLRRLVSFHGRTKVVDVTTAHERIAGAAITAKRDVPHYTRAAMDGYAVRATDTQNADEQSPVTLMKGDRDVREGEAIPVHTGSPLPDGADAVVLVERTETRNGEVRIQSPVQVGANVAPAGEDVEAGDRLCDSGDRLTPPDIALFRSAGIREIPIVEKASVGVIPTGEELVEADPKSGEVVETNGRMVKQYVSQWGGSPVNYDIVSDDLGALKDAIREASDHDIIIMIGGSSVGDRDLVPDALAEIGSVLLHGVAIKPGHPVGIGHADETPVILLPGYPVSCVITAVQIVRHALAWVHGSSPVEAPTSEARLQTNIHSDLGERTFTRTRIEQEDGERIAVPIRTSGAGVLSSVTQADGWIEINEDNDGANADEIVEVQDWDRLCR